MPRPLMAHNEMYEKIAVMTEVIDAWGIIWGAIAVGAIAVAFRAEILVRARDLEEKVQTLFELLIEGKKFATNQ